MKPHLPAYLTRHHAAQDAGHFTPYHTMKHHANSIITNARTGRPVSARNRKKRSFARLAILTGLALFWVGVAALVLL